MHASGPSKTDSYHTFITANNLMKYEETKIGPHYLRLYAIVQINSPKTKSVANNSLHSLWVF